MKVELGANVYSSDNKTLGAIKYVILNVETLHVTMVAIAGGIIHNREIELPVNDLIVDAEKSVRVCYTEEEVNNLEPFVAERYTTGLEDEKSPLTYPVGGLIWGASNQSGDMTGAGMYLFSAPPPLGQVAKSKIDEHHLLLDKLDKENALVGTGAVVTSHDGDKVGELNGLTFDAGTGRVVELRIRQGMFINKEFSLGGETLALADDNELDLTLRGDQIDQEVLRPTG